jgi:hypothetical protein
MTVLAPVITRPLPAKQSDPDRGTIWGSALQKPQVLAMLLRSRRMIGHGTYGAVYAVSAVAVKVGYVPPQEAERQNWVYSTLQAALPVIAYASQIELPEAVTRQACPIHGLGYDEESWFCHCSEPMDVLVMPQAKYNGEAFFTPEVRRLIQQVQRDLCERFNFFWEEKPSHLLKYDGRILLCDFGEEEVDEW